MKTKDVIQKEMKSAVITSLEDCNEVAIKASVGMGKTKVLLEVLDYFNPPKITWLTSDTELRDKDTVNEFHKWGYAHLLERTNILCYQTAYKTSGEDLGFVVMDEADFSLTPEYIKSITDNTYSKCVMASGTYTDKQREFIEELGFSLVYELTTGEAQEHEALNKTKVVFVEYELSTVKDRLIQVKDRSWFSSENADYVYQNDSYNAAYKEYLRMSELISNHYNGIEVIEGFVYADYKSSRNAARNRMKFAASRRAKILHTLKSSRTHTISIARRLQAVEGNKVLVFSALTAQSDYVCQYTYHSKNKKDNPNMDNFNEGIINTLGVVGIVNRGKNLEGLNYAIMESYDGSATKGNQQLGRLARLAVDKVATIYVLVPYYTAYVNNEIKRFPTRAAGWAQDRYMSADLSEDSFRTIHINKLLEELECHQKQMST